MRRGVDIHCKTKQKRLIMTSIEWLIEELTPSIALQQKYIDELKDKAKKMHQQEIENAYWDGGQDIPMSEKSCEQYYQETFVSKGSDDHIVDTNEMIELPQQEKSLSDKWKEYQDWLNEPSELSDEEIEKEAEKRSKSFNGFTTYEKSAWVMACKWYREQLKNKK
jgi:hypothetical protein